MGHGEMVGAVAGIVGRGSHVERVVGLPQRFGVFRRLHFDAAAAPLAESVDENGGMRRRAHEVQAPRVVGVVIRPRIDEKIPSVRREFERQLVFVRVRYTQWPAVKEQVESVGVPT